METLISGAQNEEVIIANTKFHSDENLNVTDAQSDRINDVIEMYDCNFMTMMQHATRKVVIYSNELDATLSKCNEHHKHTIHSRVAAILTFTCFHLSVSNHNGQQVQCIEMKMSMGVFCALAVITNIMIIL
jgi:hypothetical protein